MDKYSKPAEKRLKGIHPDLKAKEALVRAEFTDRMKEEFFNEAFGELMFDYYIKFMETEPHEHPNTCLLYTSPSPRDS